MEETYKSLRLKPLH